MNVPFALASLALIMALWTALAVYQAAGPRSAAITAVGILVLMTVQYAAASSGLLRQWDRTPPPILPLVLVCVALTVMLAFSSIGTAMAAALSFESLIAAQVFRLPLELTMHRAALDGLMPSQMSYNGCNFEIVTGATAGLIAMGSFLGSPPRWLILAWNAMGSFLLLAIVVIAVISMPTFAAFGQDRLNTWIADPPFIWLPGVLVQVALLGHLLIWRKLSLTRSH